LLCKHTDGVVERFLSVLCHGVAALPLEAVVLMMLELGEQSDVLAM
jgi:hypothetical protein